MFPEKKMIIYYWGYTTTLEKIFIYLRQMHNDNLVSELSLCNIVIKES